MYPAAPEDQQWGRRSSMWIVRPRRIKVFATSKNTEEILSPAGLSPRWQCSFYFLLTQPTSPVHNPWRRLSKGPPLHPWAPHVKWFLHIGCPVCILTDLVMRMLPANVFASSSDVHKMSGIAFDLLANRHLHYNVQGLECLLHSFPADTYHFLKFSSDVSREIVLSEIYLPSRENGQAVISWNVFLIVFA